MNRGKAMLIVVGILAACGVSAAAASGQEPGGEEDRTEKLKQELRRIDIASKPGDEVVTLRDAELMVETKSVGSVPKGGKCTVEQVQDNWLWVRSGETRGWIESTSVIDAGLNAWYERQPDMTNAPLEASVDFSVGKTGRVRGKILGVLLELRGLQPGEDAAICFDHPGPGTTVIGSGVVVIGDTVAAKGHRATLRENGVFVAYKAMALSLDKLSRQTRVLMVNGRSYGSLREGDHVLIDSSERVFVNGQLRRPQ